MMMRRIIACLEITDIWFLWIYMYCTEFKNN